VTTQSRRDAFIAGLRELATFIENTPEAPIPPYPEILCGVDADHDSAGFAAVELAAEALGVEPEQRSDSVVADRQFSGGDYYLSGLRYHVYYNTRDSQQRYVAATSYLSSVEPS